MFVSDLRHFLDMPDDAPGPARKMADQLRNIGPGRHGSRQWLRLGERAALPAPPRPPPCPRTSPSSGPTPTSRSSGRAPSCHDEGVISGWHDSPFDLRRPRSNRPQTSGGSSLAEVAAALEDLRRLDRDRERPMFSAPASSEGNLLAANDADLEELIGYMADEASPGRRRQKRLDIAFAVLSDALQ